MCDALTPRWVYMEMESGAGAIWLPALGGFSGRLGGNVRRIRAAGRVRGDGVCGVGPWGCLVHDQTAWHG